MLGELCLFTNLNNLEIRRTAYIPKTTITAMLLRPSERFRCTFLWSSVCSSCWVSAWHRWCAKEVKTGIFTEKTLIFHAPHLGLLETSPWWLCAAVQAAHAPLDLLWSRFVHPGYASGLPTVEMKKPFPIKSPTIFNSLKSILFQLVDDEWFLSSLSSSQASTSFRNASITRRFRLGSST